MHRDLIRENQAKTKGLRKLLFLLYLSTPKANLTHNPYSLILPVLLSILAVMSVTSSQRIPRIAYYIIYRSLSGNFLALVRISNEFYYFRNRNCADVCCLLLKLFHKLWTTYGVESWVVLYMELELPDLQCPL